MLSYIFNPAERGNTTELSNINEKILCFIWQSMPLTLDEDKSILPHSYLNRNIVTEAFELGF